MKKLFTILALVSFMGIFSACEEEEITPDKLETTDSQPDGKGEVEGF